MQINSSGNLTGNSKRILKFVCSSALLLLLLSACSASPSQHGFGANQPDRSAEEADTQTTAGNQTQWPGASTSGTKKVTADAPAFHPSPKAPRVPVNIPDQQAQQAANAAPAVNQQQVNQPVNPPVAQSPVPNPPLAAPLVPEADVNLPVDPQAPAKPKGAGDLLVFQVQQSGLKFFSDAGGMHKINLAKGDQLDVLTPDELQMDSVAEQRMGVEAYVKLGLKQAFPNQLISMSVNTASDAKLVGSRVYVNPDDLSQMKFVELSDEQDAGEDLGEQTVNAPVLTPVNPPEAGDQAITNMIAASFLNYSNNATVKRMISDGESHLYTVDVRGARHLRYMKGTQGYCYRAVKDALRGSGMVPASFQGGASAFMARGDLLAQGFTDLLTTDCVGAQCANYSADMKKYPQAAPAGAILVYRGGSNGHVEIKIKPPGEEGFVSITITEKPAYGLWPAERTLIGVMVKNGL